MSEQPVSKKSGRPKKVLEQGDVIKVLEEKKEEPTEISYHEAKQKVKVKREMTEKQKANIDRLIEMNRLRREKQKEEDEKRAEEERKATELEDAKLKTYIVRPKRPYKKKEKPVKAIHPETNEDIYPEDTDAETTDTRTINKKLEHINKINSKLEEVKHNPYASLLKKYFS
jgi:hypothetical protein